MWTYWDNAFTEEGIEKIKELCQKKELERGTIAGATTSTVDEKIRHSNISFHSISDENAWIFKAFNDIIYTLNEQFYNFELNGYDSFQYSEYRGDEQGKYDWHVDLLFGDTNNPMTAKSSPGAYGQTRKLSLVMNLTAPGEDYEGGMFQMHAGNIGKPTDILLPKGKIIVFPSFMPHRVTPITSGIRKSIVIWVLGPKFM